jgi:arginyl-tRNA synthetase
LDKNDNSRNARIAISLATKAVIKDGLGILGIVAPEKM